jgi:catechol 2,3-dioxygenase-like lactoylglutathione lyase family enzyme
MQVVRLDHATITTADLPASIAFYGHFLGLKPGWRPNFSRGGAWLYPEGGDYPIVHLIEKDGPADGGKFDHLAFRVTGLNAYLAKVKAAGAKYMAVPVDETNLVQIQHRDPNHVLIEATFEDEVIAPSDIIGPERCRP